MLTATAIRHDFGASRVLDGVDLTVMPGEILGITGPSGAGKSTLGRILAGHVRPSSGRVLIDDGPLAPRTGEALAVQYAPQASELSIDPRWRVGRILHNGGIPDRHACGVLGIRPEWFERFPGELSGGELARVSLARLVLPTTRYLVCDEVTGPLDAIAAAEMASALRHLAREGMGIVLISHDTGLMIGTVDRAVVLRAGRLERLDAPYPVAAPR